MKLLIASVFAIFTVACASGNCRSQPKPSDAASEKAVMQTPANPSDRVRVYKYDGSLQCGKGKAVSPEDMQKKDLKDIQVYSAANKSDGMMRIQLCGSPTGKANVYEIDRSQLSESKKRGFKEWTAE